MGARTSCRHSPCAREIGRKHGVAVAEDIRPNLDRFAGDPFDRKPPGFDSRINILDVERRRTAVKGPALARPRGQNSSAPDGQTWTMPNGDLPRFHNKALPQQKFQWNKRRVDHVETALLADSGSCFGRSDIALDTNWTSEPLGRAQPES